MANLKVTLVKSTIGAVPKHKKTVEALGLKKLHKTVELPDNEATRGMIKQVQHLVKVKKHNQETDKEVLEWIYQFKTADGAKQSGNFRRGRGHVPETARQPARDTRVRRHVPAEQDQVLKADRCHYTEEFQREASNALIPKISLALM